MFVILLILVWLYVVIRIKYGSLAAFYESIRGTLKYRRILENPELAETAIEDLFEETRQLNYIDSDYERAIVCACASGASDSLCLFFATLFMMAVEGEVELKKYEIIFRKDSLLSHRTTADQSVRKILTGFKAQNIEDRPGWMSVQLQNMYVFQEDQTISTAIFLDSVFRFIANCYSEALFFNSQNAYFLSRIRAYYQNDHQPYRMDEMVWLIESNELTPRDLFNFLYINDFNNVGYPRVSPSGGIYAAYDDLYDSMRKTGDVFLGLHGKKAGYGKQPNFDVFAKYRK